MRYWRFSGLRDVQQSADTIINLWYCEQSTTLYQVYQGREGHLKSFDYIFIALLIKPWWCLVIVASKAAQDANRSEKETTITNTRFCVLLDEIADHADDLTA